MYVRAHCLSIDPLRWDSDSIGFGLVVDLGHPLGLLVDRSMDGRGVSGLIHHIHTHHGTHSMKTPSPRRRTSMSRDSSRAMGRGRRRRPRRARCCRRRSPEVGAFDRSFHTMPPQKSMTRDDATQPTSARYVHTPLKKSHAMGHAMQARGTRTLRG